MLFVPLGLGRYLASNPDVFSKLNKVSSSRIFTNRILTRHLSLKPNLSKFKLIPSPPGGVKGGLNDAFQPPEPNHFHGSYHWDYERITAASLLPLTTISLYISLNGGVVHPLLDASLCVMLVVHAHYGFMSCIIDYIPKRKFGIWHDMARYLLYSGSALALYGVYDLETRNNGIVDLVGKLWSDQDSGFSIFDTR
ncbi:hypothetical protein HG537_0C01420 [Torulaspora globosa]|uniref:Succinate dehydrogenase [ubiquinone] cytochrome b small subunit n=1 Tax=Torulaspora globosa TaxID=48254 RepID=A0A7H9HSY4_9SACH|nr:hypothetical protein HG537_0C01420 [Torulaspora sp. CBS 2947]